MSEGKKTLRQQIKKDRVGTEPEEVNHRGDAKGNKELREER